jgi:hypothetical protein
MSEEAPKRTEYFSGAGNDGRPFVAMVYMTNEDGEELKNAIEFVQFSLKLKRFPTPITEAEAKLWTEGQKQIMVNYQLYVWWLDS